MESATLSEALAGSREETGALIRRLRATEQTLAQHGAELDEERSISAAARAELALLNRQILELRRRLEEIATALAAAEAVKQAQEAEIADLGKRLNIALAREVNRLSRYQSEFFGRLREVLAARGARRESRHPCRGRPLRLLVRAAVRLRHRRSR
jgi:chemotaxis protein MotB